MQTKATFREENLEEVRRLNELILAAKCNTILDNQVQPDIQSVSYITTNIYCKSRNLPNIELEESGSMEIKQVVEVFLRICFLCVQEVETHHI